jgi:hypothetical protein
MKLDMTARVALCCAAMGALGTGCVSYGGIAKATDGKVYLTGSTSFLVFSSSWVKRCVEKGTELVCEEIAVKPKAAPAVEKPAKEEAEAEDEDEEATPRKSKRKK